MNQLVALAVTLILVFAILPPSVEVAVNIVSPATTPVTIHELPLTLAVAIFVLSGTQDLSVLFVASVGLNTTPAVTLAPTVVEYEVWAN